MIEWFLPYIIDDVVDIQVIDYGLHISGFQNTLESIFGSPILNVFITHSSGNTSGFTMVNPLFITGVLLFALCLYSCFRILFKAIFR